MNPDQELNIVYEDLDLDGKGLTGNGCLYVTPRPLPKKKPWTGSHSSSGSTASPGQGS